MKIDPKVTPIRHLETQKRPNTEPQGVPEALETLIRKMNIFCFWARLGRTQGDMICIACAIRRLYAAFGVHFSLSGHCLPSTL